VRLLQNWHGVFGNEPKTVQEAAASVAASTHGSERDLHASFLEVAGERGNVNTLKLGRWMGRYKLRIEGGLRIEPGGEKGGSGRWRVVQTKPTAKPLNAAESRGEGEIGELFLTPTEKSRNVNINNNREELETTPQTPHLLGLEGSHVTDDASDPAATDAGAVNGVPSVPPVEAPTDHDGLEWLPEGKFICFPCSGTRGYRRRGEEDWQCGTCAPPSSVAGN
jgi:hypothetical protein